MEVGIIGAGHIGGGLARQLSKAGHAVLVSFARNASRLAALADEVGARSVTPSEAARADVVVVSVPWDAIDAALAAAGSLAGRIVIDTTNQFSRSGVVDLEGRTAARVNADRMVGARYTKTFNTLTAGFQAAASLRTGEDRVVQWIAGDDSEAEGVVARLVADAGFVPIDLAGIDGCAAMEAPRRTGAVYGEDYRAADAAAVVVAVREGLPAPPPPTHA